MGHCLVRAYLLGFLYLYLKHCRILNKLLEEILLQALYHVLEMANEMDSFLYKNIMKYATNPFTFYSLNEERLHFPPIVNRI